MCDEFDTSCVAGANDIEPARSYGVDMTTNTKGGVMKRKGSRRLVARLGLALAVAAVAAPGAQAMTMNATYEAGGGVVPRLYADDLHQSFPVAMLKASNVRTDASGLPYNAAANVVTDSVSFQGEPVSDPGANVVTDSVSFQGEPISDPAANVRTDSATPPQPVSSLIADVQTDGASSGPLTDDRHTALLKHQAQLGQEPAELASTPLSSPDSPGIDWGVAAIGAALGMLGLMLLFSIVFYAGRHHRGRLAAT